MEVGSFFEFPELDCHTPDQSILHTLESCFGMRNHHYLFFGDGRQAIKAILLSSYELLKDRVCYLPAYLCGAILQPFVELGLDVAFYSHGHPLKFNLDFTIRNALIYVLDYFGVEELSNQEIASLAQNGNVVIVDITHSILNSTRFELENEGIFLLASLRKSFPIPDGAVVYCTGDPLPIELHRASQYTVMLEAMVLRKYYQNPELISSANSLKEIYRRLYKNFEATKDLNEINLEAMSEISFLILAQLSIDNIIRRRLINLNFLYQNIEPLYFLFEHDRIKSPFIAPLIFPDNLERDAMQAELTRQGIYPPIHWKLPKEVDSSYSYEHHLSSTILSIPVDQRYSETDLERVPTILKNKLSRR